MCLYLSVLQTNEHRSDWQMDKLSKRLKSTLILLNLLLPSAACSPKLIIRNTGGLLHSLAEDIPSVSQQLSPAGSLFAISLLLTDCVALNSNYQKGSSL